MRLLSLFAALAAAAPCSAEFVFEGAACYVALDTTAGRTEADSLSAPRMDAPAVASSADRQPTPMMAVTYGLWALRLTPADVLVDFGCGYDCRWGVTAARVYGCRVIAVEIDPAAAASARRYVAHAGLSHLVEVRTGDAATMEFSAATAGCAYLWQDDLARLAPQIRRLKRFASYAHDVPGLPQSPLRVPDCSEVYVWRQPPPAVAETKPLASWGGRVYSRPVCNRAGCTMCAAIRRQLAAPLTVQPAAPAATVKQSSQAPAGRWVRVCANGRCTRVWQPY